MFLKINEHLTHGSSGFGSKMSRMDGGGNEDCIELNYQREQPGWSPPEELE